MKRIIYFIFGFVYLAGLVFSLIVLIKPGASFFYKKLQIQVQNLIRKGDAFEYQFKVNSHFYNPDTILILEDKQVLRITSLDYTKSSEEDQINILFVPIIIDDPATNGLTYSILIRPYLISSNLGGIGLLLLILGLVVFFWCILSYSRLRKMLSGSKFGLATFQKKLIDSTDGKNEIPERKQIIIQSIVNTVLLSFFYVSMEWVFFITKPSFMDMLTLGEKVKILPITGLAVSLLSLFTLFVIFLLDLALAPVIPSYRKYAYHLPFTFLATSLCFILIDNFTYTVFKFGIVDTKTLVRVMYALVFSALFFHILRARMATKKLVLTRGSFRLLIMGAVFLFAISLIFAGFSFKSGNSAISQVENYFSAKIKPNIILLSTDGLNAQNMSAYGYSRNTTPFITELAKTALLCQNNFTNADSSTGSETSLLTGKSPFTTHVLFPPDILRGVDMFQHLHGLLKRNGYRTVSLGGQYFIDANAVNFQNAFDAVNCTNNPSSSFSGYGYDDEIYFLNTIAERIWDRISHIFFISDMQNPYTSVTQTVAGSNTDSQRMRCLRTYLEDAFQSEQPLFAHIHLMATHGSKFPPSIKVFSKDKTQDHEWMIDFYDDAILGFDIQVEQLVHFLKERDQYQNTILVLYTDHGQEWTTIEKLPLIMHFPNDQHIGTITENTQNLDIAPTILDYLGIQKPAWMEGSSLFGKLDPDRLILAGIKNQDELIYGSEALSVEALRPPFYQFSMLSVIQCQNWFIFNLDDMTVSMGEIEIYKDLCSADMLDTQEVIRKKVGDALKQFGYKLPDNW